MVKFIKKIILFGVLFFLLDKLFILLIQRLPDLEVDKRLEMTIEGKINKDLIIIGSSRGARNIIAERIQNETGLSSYNLSYPGSDVTFHEFTLRTLVKFNQPPKILVLTVDDASELVTVLTTHFRLERIYPLIKYDWIRQELINRGEKNKILSKYFVLHRLNVSNFDLRKKKFTPLDSIYACGSMHIASQKKNVKWVYVDEIRPYFIESEAPDKLKALNNIFKICKEKNIKLIMVFSPNFKRNSVSFENRMKELAGNETLYYHYNMLNPIYKDSNYFYDKSHLRNNGAEIFTDELISYIKDNVLLNNPAN